MDILSVSEDKQTGYVTVSVDHHSPFVAEHWINWLVEDVNDAVKAQDVAFVSRQSLAQLSLFQMQSSVTISGLSPIPHCIAHPPIRYCISRG